MRERKSPGQISPAGASYRHTGGVLVCGCPNRTAPAVQPQIKVLSCGYDKSLSARDCYAVMSIYDATGAFYAPASKRKAPGGYPEAFFIGLVQSKDDDGEAVGTQHSTR